MKDDGAGYARVAWEWLFPVRVYVDPDGDQLVELAWRDGGRWVTRLIRRSLTRSGRKLIAEAGDAGLPVIEADAKQAERWLAAAEAANRGAIARHPVARQLGWQADGKTFVTGQDAPWRVEPRYSDQAAALAAHRPNGTLAGWKDAIAEARDYIVVQVGAYAGLASPLLHPLGLDSFTVDFSGRSSRGKTVTAMVALSCWADPRDRSEGMLTWQTASVIGIEKRLNLVSGLTVVVDETRLVRDPALVDAVLYMIPKNHGRPRGGGWPNMIPWHAIVVSTGEQAATSFTSHQGASARVLSVQLPPFGTDGADGRTAAEAVKAGIEANCGTAGPAFAARLQARLAEDGGAGKLRTRHQELTEMLRGSTDMAGRRAPLAACMALAAELAEKWAIVPFAAPDVASWSGLFASDEQRDNRPEMALDLVASTWRPTPTRCAAAMTGATRRRAGGSATRPRKVRRCCPRSSGKSSGAADTNSTRSSPAGSRWARCSPWTASALHTSSRGVPPGANPGISCSAATSSIPRIPRTANEKYMFCDPLQTLSPRKLRTTLKMARDLHKGRYAAARTAYHSRPDRYVLRTSCVPARVPAF